MKYSFDTVGNPEYYGQGAALYSNQSTVDSLWAGAVSLGNTLTLGSLSQTTEKAQSKATHSDSAARTLEICAQREEERKQAFIREYGKPLYDYLFADQKQQNTLLQEVATDVEQLLVIRNATPKERENIARAARHTIVQQVENGHINLRTPNNTRRLKEDIAVNIAEQVAPLAAKLPLYDTLVTKVLISLQKEGLIYGLAENAKTITSTQPEGMLQINAISRLVGKLLLNDTTGFNLEKMQQEGKLHYSTNPDDEERIRENRETADEFTTALAASIRDANPPIIPLYRSGRMDDTRMPIRKEEIADERVSEISNALHDRFPGYRLSKTRAASVVEEDIPSPLHASVGNNTSRILAERSRNTSSKAQPHFLIEEVKTALEVLPPFAGKSDEALFSRLKIHRTMSAIKESENELFAVKGQPTPNRADVSISKSQLTQTLMRNEFPRTASILTSQIETLIERGNAYKSGNYTAARTTSATTSMFR